MAVRQYVGARYVLKIYQNSQDPQSADWESGVSYEPLTMVNYNNSSYISRSQVPASVGDPVSNPTYWALSGLYNGQIAQLQQDINDLDEKVDKLHTRYYVFISDSYGSYPGNDGYTFVEKAIHNNGLTEGDTAYNFHTSGAGFAASTTFLSVLQSNEATIDDKDKITDVIVIGSANDQGHSYSDIRSAIYTFSQYIASNYPNAKLYLASMSKSLRQDNIAGINDAVKAYQDATDQGCGFIENSQFAMTQISTFKTDMRHPSENAVDYLGNLLTNYIKTGSMSVSRKFMNTSNFELTGTSWQNRTGSNQPTTECSQNNGVVSYNFALRGYIAYGETIAAITIPANGSKRIDAGIKMVDSYFYPKANNRSNFDAWFETNDNLLMCDISWDQSTIANSGFSGDVVIHNNTASSITIASGTNFALYSPGDRTVII